MSGRGRGAAGAPRGRGRGAAKRPREDDAVGGAGGDTPAAESKSSPDPAVKDALVAFLQRYPDGAPKDQVDSAGLGDPDTVMHALNALLANRVVGVYSRRGPGDTSEQVLRLVQGEQELADLTCVFIVLVEHAVVTSEREGVDAQAGGVAGVAGNFQGGQPWHLDSQAEDGYRVD